MLARYNDSRMASYCLRNGVRVNALRNAPGSGGLLIVEELLESNSRENCMSPVTHFLAGWSVANARPLSRRDRPLVTISGVIPDADGLGMIPDWLTRHSLNCGGEYHHVLFHNIGFGLMMCGWIFLLSRQRWLAALLALGGFHLHLFPDLIGARGPDGYQWPIPYLQPFSDAWQLAWEGQWSLTAWQNFVLTGLLLLPAFWWAWQKGFSPLEMFSTRADQAFVRTLRVRFGNPFQES